MYELYYWPGLQGRGERVRLALEDAAAPYVDVARSPEHGGVAAMKALLEGEGVEGPPPFAPPCLRDGDLVIAHTANILLYLGPRLGLVPSDERARLHAHQLELSVTDLFAEVHDTHHPVGVSLYYEDQRAEALRAAQTFLRDRLPKYLGYFERVLERAGGDCALGVHSYVDLSLFQLMAGLSYAFPRAMKALSPRLPRLTALGRRVTARPNVHAYLSSSRRVPFNEHGIFRRYPELDLLPGNAA